MSTNRLATPSASAKGRKFKECPPDMPHGKSEEQKAARQRYWIERGNRDLMEAGQHHLHWVCVGGNYFIEERTETMRRTMMAKGLGEGRQ